MSRTVTGANTIVAFRYENSFDEAPDASGTNSFRAFGTATTFDPDPSNNPERMFEPFNRTTQTIIETAFDGSWSVDATLTNFEWLDFLYGDDSTTVDISDPPKTAAIVEETHYPNGDIEQTVYTGCALSDASLDISVEDVIDLSLSGAYRTQETTVSQTASDLPLGEAIDSQPSVDNRPFHFGSAVVNIDLNDDGTAEAQATLQDASLDLDQSTEMEYEIGSRLAKIPSFLQFEPTLDYTRLVTQESQSTERKQMYGGPGGATSPQTTMGDAGVSGNIVYSNGDGLTVTANFTGAFPENYTRNNIGDPQSALEEDVSRFVEEVTFNINSTSSP